MESDRVSVGGILFRRSSRSPSNSGILVPYNASLKFGRLEDCVARKVCHSVSLSVIWKHMSMQRSVLSNAKNQSVCGLAALAVVNSLRLLFTSSGWLASPPSTSIGCDTVESNRGRISRGCRVQRGIDSCFVSASECVDIFARSDCATEVAFRFTIRTNFQTTGSHQGV